MIVTFGSINMDLNVGIGSFPQPGETVLSLDYQMTPGGKGGNQALAAARSGAKTALVGKVGDDGFGLRVVNFLRRNEVVTSGIATSEALPTGLAVVMRDKVGENQIVVALGANAEISATQVPDEILRAGNYVLLQMEVPLKENIEVMGRAKKNGAKVILNVAPAQKIPAQAFSLVDYLILNELEAAYVANMLGMDADKDSARVAKSLSKAGNLTCIITLGAKGTVATRPDGSGFILPAMPVEDVVDTTGAGDCYCGTFAACLHNGMSLIESLKRASVAAGLSCQKIGTQEAYPYQAEIEESLPAQPEAQSI